MYSENKTVDTTTLGTTKIILLLGDLLRENVDVVVNAANRMLKPGGGICGCFYDQAGQEIFDECRSILQSQGRTAIETGQAVMTSSGKLSNVKAIIHAAGPIYDSSRPIEEQSKLLAQTYTSCLELAKQAAAKSIGFPSISTGIYHFPIREAAKAALGAIKEFVLKNPGALEEIRFVFFDRGEGENTTCQSFVDQLS